MAAQRLLPQEDTGIVDSSATHFYIYPSAPHGPTNTSPSQISVGTDTEHVERLSSNDTLTIPQLAADFPTTGYIMPYFNNTLVGVGPICNAECIVLFTKKYVTEFSPGVKPILTVWREKELLRLWRFSLKLTKELLLHHTTEIRQKTLLLYSDYDIPSTEVLVRYMHVASGFPFNPIWLRSIKRGIFETWIGLT